MPPPCALRGGGAALAELDFVLSGDTGAARDALTSAGSLGMMIGSAPAAAKLLLSAQEMPNSEQIEEVKATVRQPEVWILYTLVSDKELAGLIKEGFREQEKETKASASAFWESLG